jgi:sortase (surface protein transpeptidase)
MRRFLGPVLLVVAVILAVAAWAVSVSEPDADHRALPMVAPPDVGKPIDVRIPALGVAEPLRPVGMLADGAMETPPFGDVGWYALGPAPGTVGGAVIVAHVHGPQGDDVFAHLADLNTGDRVEVGSRAGRTTFAVDDVVQVPKEELPYGRIWPDRTSRRLLSLITCGGRRTAAGYADNTIVFAHAIARGSRK